MILLWRFRLGWIEPLVYGGKGEELRTTKADAANHGIGIPSVRRTAEKYQGTVAIDDAVSGHFVIRVILYGLSTEKVT